jgi:hypothetical protein
MALFRDTSPADRSAPSIGLALPVEIRTATFALG